MGQTNRNVIFLSICAKFYPSTPPPLPSEKKKGSSKN